MLHWSCEDKSEHLSLPSIQTIEVHNIVSTSVVSGGTIHFDGGAKIIEKGICWDINPLPTHNLITKRTSQINSSTFEIDITNLVPNTRYYIRAYAINNVGISYGNEVSFVTNSSSSIQYSKDGRTVQYGDLLPIALDISGDKEVDYTIFVEATASSKGIRLYAGVNPIRANLIKSGPPIDDNFLNMGLIIPQQDGSIIDHNLDSDQRWTSDFSALVIRNTDVAGVTTYEGHWSGQDQMVPFTMVGLELSLTKLQRQ